MKILPLLACFFAIQSSVAFGSSFSLDEDGLNKEDFAQFYDMPNILKSMRHKEFDKDKSKNVKYLNEDERWDFELRARNGRLFLNYNDEAFDSKKLFDRSLLYIISPTGKIYAARGKRGLMHHSSFLAGADIMAAGKITTEDGKVVFLSSNSGHYRPKPRHFLQGIKHLHDLGVLSPHAIVEVRHHGEMPLKDAVSLLQQLALKKTKSS